MGALKGSEIPRLIVTVVSAISIEHDRDARNRPVDIVPSPHADV
jgi:hypothetical protein